MKKQQTDGSNSEREKNILGSKAVQTVANPGN